MICIVILCVIKQWQMQAKCLPRILQTGDHVDGILQLQSLPVTPLSMYLLGKSMWDADGKYRKDKKNCFTALVKVLYISLNFSLLYYYRLVCLGCQA